MIVNWELNAGIVVGLQADEILMCVDEEESEFELANCWYLHLGIITLAFIFA